MGDPNLLQFGPYVAGAPDTIKISRHSIIIIPNKYVGLFLSLPDGVPPRYLFETILPVIEADGMGQSCMLLTYFCQMAITITAARGGSPIQVVHPIPPS